jgi:glutathione S-transferase
MITLFHAPGSCSLAVKAALALSGLEYQITEINALEGEHLSEVFKKINPLKKVPALEVEGTIITEGAAILQYISERSPETGLLPELGTLKRAEALKWMMFVYSNIHPSFVQAFHPERYGQDTADIKDKAEIQLHLLFEIVDDQLAKHNYIAGDQLTIADLYLAVAINWQIVLKKSLTKKYQHVSRYLKLLMQLPVIGDIYSAELS